MKIDKQEVIKAIVASHNCLQRKDHHIKHQTVWQLLDSKIQNTKETSQSLDALCIANIYTIQDSQKYSTSPSSICVGFNQSRLI